MHHRVRRQDYECLSVDLLTAQVESRYIDIVVSQGSAKITDDTGFVVVGYDEHMPLRDYLDSEFVDPDDSEILSPEDGAHRIARFLGCFDSQRYHARIILCLAAS